MIEAVARRKPGFSQGLTVILTGFLPILAIVSFAPGVGAMIAHFAPTNPNAATIVPSMVTAPGLSIAIIALFAGAMVDRWGRRQLLIASTFAYGLVGVIPFFLEDLDAIYASRLALGVCEAAILTTVNTLIADYWDEGPRRNWLTLQGLVGPALSSVMFFFAGSLTAWRWNGMFLLYLLAIPIAIAMVRYIYEPESDATLRRNLGMDEAEITAGGFPWTTMLGVGALTLFTSLIYYVFIVNNSIVWEELGVSDPETIGQIISIPSLFILAGAALFWFMGRRGLGARWQMAAALGFLGTGLAMMGLTDGWQGMVAGMMVQQTGAGMAVPTMIAWAQQSLPPAYRGRGMGLWTAAFFLGQFLSPLILSAIRAEAGSMQGAFLVAGLASIAGGLVAAVMLRTRTAEAV